MITPADSRSLTVMWETVPCLLYQGPITEYRLHYVYSTLSVHVSNTVGVKSSHHNLTGLTPFTNYSVILEVAAVNDGGTGPYSDLVHTHIVETLQDSECMPHDAYIYHSTPTCYIIKMFTVPGPVSGLSATPGVVQLTISWSPPSESNGVIIAYEVCSNSSGVFSYTNTSATQLILRDLPPNTVVTFSVRAYTIIGPGENVTRQASTGSVREYRIKFSFHV